MKQLPELFKAWIEDENRDHFEGLKLLSHLTSNRTLIRNLSKKESRYNKEKLLNEIKKLRKSLLTSEIHPPHMWVPDPAMPMTDSLTAETKPEGSNPPPGKQDTSISTPPHTAAGDDSGESVSSGGEQQPATDETKETPLADHPEGSIIDSIRKVAEWEKPELPNPTPQELPIDPINADDAKSVEQLEISYSKMFNKKGMLSNSLRDFKEEENAGRKQVMDQIADINKSMQEIDAKIQHFKTHGALPELTTPNPPVETKQPAILPDDPVKITRMINNERSNISKLRRRIRKGHSDPERLAQLEENLKAKVEVVNELERRLSGSGS